MLGKIFATADGKIPYIQIAIGIILGAIGMLVYAKFCKPRILYEEKFTVPLGPSVEKKPKSLEKRKDNRNGKGNENANGNTVDVGGRNMTAPLIFEMESIQIPRQSMPPVLPDMTEVSDSSSISDSGSEIDDEDDELDELDELNNYTRDDQTGANDNSDRMALPPI